MFNPKERLQQIRKSKQAKQQSTFFHEENSPPLFESKQPEVKDNDLSVRMARLENMVNQLSSQLSSSKQVVTVLRRENSELQTKILKLEYENSQLKVVNRSNQERHHESARRQSATSRGSPADNQKEESAMKRIESHVSEVTQEQLLPQVQETLDQLKKEPIENILRRQEQNFRVLKVDPRNINGGNKVLKQFSSICKDYGKTIKKPVLVLKLQAADFE